MNGLRFSIPYLSKYRHVQHILRISKSEFAIMDIPLVSNSKYIANRVLNYILKF